MSQTSFRWREHFPYNQPRTIQAEALQALQDNWNNYDVFVVGAPTAFGKTSVAKCIINSQRSVSVITPTNMLVRQFLDEFPDTPTLSRLDSYICEEWKRPCPITRAKLMKFCKGCKCSKELVDAKHRKGPGIYNYHTYLAHKIYRDVLVVDEAHTLIHTIRDRLALRVWQHDVRYPFNMWTPEQTQAWLNTLHDKQKKTKKMIALQGAVRYRAPEYVMQRTTELFNGKGTTRGEPEERDVIKLMPVDISEAPPMFWPQEVRKIVLLSATIGYKDIEALGLHKKRVCYINCDSPIPAANRPIIPLSRLAVTRATTTPEGASRIAAILEDIADYHKGEKGVVHVTYQLATLLRGKLSERFMFHDRENKSDRYLKFRESKTDTVLVACGMYEGIDLPEDLGRWQVVAKVPWPSLGSPAIKHLSEQDPEWYYWETLKTTIQACGRICRTPEDYGVSYILDSTFDRLMREGAHLVPDWFNRAITTGE